MSRHRRKTREERQKEIWLAAKKVFLEKGYKDTTMEDIIKETELSKGGFYHYYGSKKEIFIDMMNNFNILYLKKNKNMQKLSDDLTKNEMKILLLDALLEKFLLTSEDKKLYLMFGYEIMYDNEIRDAFFQLENDFLEILSNRIGIPVKENMDTKVFISRLINALLFAQTLFDEPEVFMSQREYFYTVFEELINNLLEEDNE